MSNAAGPGLLLVSIAGVFCVALSGCHSSKMAVPKIPEQVKLEKVMRRDFTLTAPGYGIYSGNTFQVNVEADDAPSIHPGQRASVRQIPGTASVPCHVVKILRSVTAETHQGVAWLAPDDSREVKHLFREGDFVYATITLRVQHHALAIPETAVFIKNSRTWAVEQKIGKDGKPAFVPVPIQVGTASNHLVEVLAGLSEGQVVATGGAIGYLYPDFKANADD